MSKKNKNKNSYFELSMFNVLKEIISLEEIEHTVENLQKPFVEKNINTKSCKGNIKKLS
jgi:hypothetical protein